MRFKIARMDCERPRVCSNRFLVTSQSAVGTTLMKIGFCIAGISVDGVFKECEGLRVSLEPEEIETHFEVRLGILAR